MTTSLSPLHAKYYKDKKVLVTGGAGFIGSHLVDRLCAHGAHVTVLDNLSSGRIDNLATSAVHLQFIKGDITNPATVAKATTGISHLFHLAALTSVPESVAQPERYHDVNVAGTNTLYHAAAANGVRSIVFASSAAVYGPRDTLCTETDASAPASPYADTKLAGEKLGQELATAHNISMANLRFFNVHGRRQLATSPYSGVVAAFTHRLKKQQPITLYGNGEQTRDFVSVSDVVTACLHAGLCTPMRGQVINVATGTSITLRTLLSNLEADLGVTAASIDQQPARDGDIMHSTADVARLVRLLAYR